MLNISKIIMILTIILSVKSELKAQNSLNYWQIFKSDIGQCFADYKQLGKDVCNSPNTSLIKYEGLFGSIIFGYLIDDEVRLGEPRRKTIFELKQMGEAYTALAVPSLIYSYGFIFKDDYVRTTGRLLFESLALSSLINITLKFSFGRARPFMDRGYNDFELFETSNSYQSFPSGHSTVAFTIATVLSERIDRWWAYIGLYTCASLTAYERIKSDNHWLSDVILGAGIGYFSSMAIINANKTSEKSKNIIEYHSYLIPNGNGLNIGIILNF